MRSAVTEIRLSSVEDMRTHAGLLLAQHWQEVATNKPLMVLCPDWPKYLAMEAAGLVLALAAWDGDDLVGYSAGFLHSHLHYSDLRYYQNDVLFVASSHRKSRVGLDLIHATEREAKERGARAVMWHAKQGSAFDALLPRLHYRVQDIIYMREV